MVVSAQVDDRVGADLPRIGENVGEAVEEGVFGQVEPVGRLGAADEIAHRNGARAVSEDETIAPRADGQEVLPPVAPGGNLAGPPLHPSSNRKSAGEGSRV